MNSEPRISLHNHTARCKHASGAIEEYCREAIAQNVSVLGFSDHSPFPDGRADSSRMNFADLPDYLADINRMKQEFPDLTILSGLEMDYFPSLGKAFYEDTYAPYNLDYMLAAVHWVENSSPNDTPEEFCRKCVAVMIEAIKSGMFTYVVHPDMATTRCPSWNQELKAIYTDLAGTAIEYDIPLEINACGLRKPRLSAACGGRPQYPWRPVWELFAELGVPAVVGIDAHHPCDVWANADDAIKFAHELGFPLLNRQIAAKLHTKSLLL